MTDFERSLAITLGFEGGYVNDPDDPGGATNQGVTQRTYDAWRERHSLPVQPVKDMETYERDTIYRQDYWTPAKCYELRWPLCMIHFDTAVNLGVSRAMQLLEKSKYDPSMYLHERRNYYTSLANQKPTMAKFLQGWLNRVRLLGQEART